MNVVFPIILGMSSSQLTFSPSFFRGVGFSHQPVMDLYLNRPDFTLIFDTLGSLCVSFAGERRYPQLVQWQNKGQGRNHPEARQLLQPKRNLQPGRAPSGNCWCTATMKICAEKYVPQRIVWPISKNTNIRMICLEKFDNYKGKMS